MGTFAYSINGHVEPIGIAHSASCFPLSIPQELGRVALLPTGIIFKLRHYPRPADRPHQIHARARARHLDVVLHRDFAECADRRRQGPRRGALQGGVVTFKAKRPPERLATTYAEMNHASRPDRYRR